MDVQDMPMGEIGPELEPTQLEPIQLEPPKNL